jgi:hypothetical protein
MKKALRVKELEDFIRENIVEAMFISKSRLIIKAKEILNATDSEQNEQERDSVAPFEGSHNQPG